MTSIKGETAVVVMMQLQKLNLPALQRNYSFVFGFFASVSYLNYFCPVSLITDYAQLNMNKFYICVMYVLLVMRVRMRKFL